MTDISANYRELAPEEVADVAAKYADAWKSPEIPRLQHNLAVSGELEKWRAQKSVAPYDALIRCFDSIREDSQIRNEDTTVLEVGASSGYNGEVLRIGGFKGAYTASDFSPTYEEWARALYPGIDFRLNDARCLNLGDSSFTVVLSGAVIMHTLEYERVIAESTRVAAYYVVMHRTPVLVGGQPTRFFLKEGYGQPMLEIQFNEQELRGLFEKYGLTIIDTHAVFFDDDAEFGHVSYVCVKDRAFHVPV